MRQLSVSVIIPHHNRSDRIERAIDSVRGQTVCPLELIIVDDASRPEHYQKLSRFSSAAQIVALKAPVGPAGARNAGIEAARGEALAFLDDDDEWTPDKLERQLEVLSPDGKVAAVTSSIMVVDACTGAVTDTYHKRSSCTISLPLALEATPAMIQTLLIRTSIMKAMGGFDPQFRQLEDHEFFIRLAASGALIVHCPEPLARLNRGAKDNLTRQQWSFLQHQLAVVKKHRALYEASFGRDAAQVEKSKYIRRAGIRRGGVSGRCIYAWGCFLGGDYQPLRALLTTGRLASVPYSALHTN
jgi:glycosyltransferase involved in cell wall biosynthesis